MDNISVSIVCNTYNQESYIKDALESFIKQKVNFKYEILVHDDASTDGTPLIIKEYEKRYPTLIKAIYQSENQHSKKRGIVSEIQSKRAKGKYIALCEGDDFWIDEYKLQKQFDALENHPEIDICATASIKVDANSKKVLSCISPKDTISIIKVEEVIAGGGGYVATNTLMYRATLDDNMPRFRKDLILDYTLQIQGSLRGGMLYLPDLTAAYRWLAKGSWTSKMENNIEKKISWVHKVNDMLEVLDKETYKKYTTVIKEKICKNEFSILYQAADIYTMKKEPYINLYSQLKYSEKVKLYLKFYFPMLLKIKRKIKF